MALLSALTSALLPPPTPAQTALTAALTVTEQDVADLIELPPTTPERLSSREAFAWGATRNDTFLREQSETLADGSIVYTLAYRSSGATAMSALLNNVWLPWEGSLTIGDESGRQSQTVTLPEGLDHCGTPWVGGDVLVIQYQGPSSPLPQFTVTEVCPCAWLPDGLAPQEWPDEGCGNRSLKAGAGQYGASQACQVAAACAGSEDAAVGELLDGPQRAVCRLIVNNKFYGTGTLVANTGGTTKALVLTAAHLLGSALSTIELTSLTARFGFEELTCQADASGQRPWRLKTEEIEGGTIEAFDERCDVLLVKLSAKPGAASRPYYCGWSLASTAANAPHYCLHHPYGDAKKLSVASTISPFNTYGTGDNSTTCKGNRFVTGSHWRVNKWTSGCTEPGSSGSALLTPEGLVIGALTGGSSKCESPINDYFYMLYKAWNRSSDNYGKLSDSLDPRGIVGNKTNAYSGCTGYEGLTGTATILEQRSYTPSASESGGSLRGATWEALGQPIGCPAAEIQVWGVRLTADQVTVLNTSSTGAAVEMELRAGLGGETLASGSKLLSAFVGNGVTQATNDFLFAEPITVAAGTPLAVVIRLANASEGESFAPKTVSPLTAGMTASALDEAGGTWTPIEDVSLMCSLLCSGGLPTLPEESVEVTPDRATEPPSTSEEDNDPAPETNPDSGSGNTPATTPTEGLSMRVLSCGSEVTVGGAPLRRVEVYTPNGTLVRRLEAQGRPEVTLDNCGLPTGAYVVVGTTLNGQRVARKIVNR